jgi:type II secretory pathway predicted ATPase ExeA
MTMYLDHFGLREAPFRITPHTEFFFAGANRGATLDALVYAITSGEGLVKVTGEVGTGKTMLCRVLMERLPENVETIYLAVPSLSRDEMLVAVASELGINVEGASTTRILRSLQERLLALHAEGRQAVALIDEAHAMPLDTLEEVRLLSNLETGTEKLLQIVLFGQPELDEHLALPNMRQLKERITHAFRLEPLPAGDIRDYISFRLRAAGYHGPDLFGEESLRIIAEASEGLTRRINIYADKTLLAAYAAGTHTVRADHARAAIADTKIVLTTKPAKSRAALYAVAGVAAGVAVGFGLAQLATSVPPPASPPSATARGPVAPAAAPATDQAAPGGTSLPAPAEPVGTVAAAEPVKATPAPKGPESPKPAEAPRPPAAAKVAGTAKAREAPPAVEPAKTAEPSKEAGSAETARDAPIAPELAARVEAGLGLLGQPGDGRYVVQLMMTDARRQDYLAWYLRMASRTVPAESLFLYPSGSIESPKIGVILGAFPSRTEAAQALESLPASVRQFRPYVRSVEAVRTDVRKDTPA